VWHRLVVVLFEVFLFVRGLVFRGRRFRCPCCTTRLRAFTRGGGSFRTRPAAYCPRCNAKARHRRVWMLLAAHTELGQPGSAVRLLHVAPKYGLYRAIRRTEGAAYESVDLTDGPLVTTVADLTALPHASGEFGGIVCVHVLEHVDDDRAAMSEMYRVLKPGGWAVVNVPSRLDQPTHEDPTIVSADARRRAFGEPDHRRVYGADLVSRLTEAGFHVITYRATDLPADTVNVNGLSLDEHVFLCRKPLADGGAP
jgi:SAM-dependent methyltransferase